jgi:hypothetical protein
MLNKAETQLPIARLHQHFLRSGSLTRNGKGEDRVPA